MDIARVLLNEALGHHRVLNSAIDPQARYALVDRVLYRLQESHIDELNLVEIHQILKNLCRLIQADPLLLERHRSS